MGFLLSCAHVVRDVAVADDRLSEMVLSMRTYVDVVVRASERGERVPDGWGERRWRLVQVAFYMDFNRTAHK